MCSTRSCEIRILLESRLGGEEVDWALTAVNDEGQVEWIDSGTWRPRERKPVAAVLVARAGRTIRARVMRLAFDRR